MRHSPVQISADTDILYRTFANRLETGLLLLDHHETVRMCRRISNFYK
jgi:hypothetical protein